MWKNYLKVALRNITSQKEYSLINILGLSIGMASFILIFLFIRHEMSYDRYHENADRIFRVAREDAVSAKKTALTPNPMAPELAREFPEIVCAVRINNIYRKVLVSYQYRFFKEDHFVLTDPDVFRMFSFPLVKGNPDTALKDKSSLVISEDMAEKYFVDEDPIGKTLNVDNRFDFQVTGVMRNIPPNSHFHCDFLASFARADDIYWKGFSGDRTQSSLHAYILLQKGVSPHDLENKLPVFVERFMHPVIKEYAPMADQIPGGLKGLKFKLFLQPLPQIHLHSHLSAELSSNYDIRYIYIFSAIAVFILVISCVNFTNLTTAFSTRRFKEIGMRKVLGARRNQLIWQFIAESVVMVLISLLVALILFEIVRLFVNPLLGGNIIGQAHRSGTVWLILILLALGVGVASGSYPAFFMSSFQPVRALKGSLLLKSKKFSRSILVVTQFVITIGIIFCAILISRQLHYLKNKKLGFQKDYVIVLPLEDRAETKNYSLLKHELLKNTHILNVTGASNVLSRVYSTSPFWWEGAQDNESMRMNKLFVDYDFIDTFGIKIIDGRSFLKEVRTDEKSAFIINGAAAKAFGWDSPVGRKIAWSYKKEEKGTVVGVIEDFHFRSLHQKIEPLILLVREKNFNDMYIRIQNKNTPSTLSFIQKTWRKFLPQRPMEYFFLDDDIDKMYKSEAAMGKLFWYISALAIFISCLGLFGLISYATEQRTKEIGIRRVLGATVFGVLMLLSKEFLRLLALANLIALPLAYYLMHNWLLNFAYRVDISILIYILAAASTILIALLTMSIRSVKAALADPAETLRYE